MTETQGLIVAFVWGVLFNWLITRWGRSQFAEGFTAVWVVIGVFMTLVISATVHVSLPRLHLTWQDVAIVLSNQQHAAIYELKFFIAAGLPMFIGSLWRYLMSEISFDWTIDD